MGLYVEVMCDELKDWPSDGNFYNTAHRCYSNNSDNPQGHSVAEARKAARKEGWVISGGYACCPGCREDMKGDALPSCETDAVFA